jgi:hypothetical protein
MREYNSISKWLNGNLIKQVVAVLYYSSLDKTLWAEIANALARLKNWSPAAVLKSGVTLYRAWNN